MKFKVSEDSTEEIKRQTFLWLLRSVYILLGAFAVIIGAEVLMASPDRKIEKAYETLRYIFLMTPLWIFSVGLGIRTNFRERFNLIELKPGFVCLFKLNGKSEEIPLDRFRMISVIVNDPVRTVLRSDGQRLFIVILKRKGFRKFCQLPVIVRYQSSENLRSFLTDLQVTTGLPIKSENFFGIHDDLELPKV